jgi:hypothetical protein
VPPILLSRQDHSPHAARRSVQVPRFADLVTHARMVERRDTF